MQKLNDDKFNDLYLVGVYYKKEKNFIDKMEQVGRSINTIDKLNLTAII